MAKKIGVAALVLLLALALTLGILWRRVTALPDWYVAEDMIAEDGGLAVDPDWVQIPSSEGQGTAPEAEQPYQLRNPHLRAPRGKGGEQLRKVVKQSRAVYDKSKRSIEAGAVINMGKLDVDTLSPRDRERYQDTVEAFPALTGRDVYLGVEGDVRNEGGKIVFGRGAKLRIGKTRYSMKRAAKRLGMSEGDLREILGTELGRMNIELPE